MYFVLQKGRTCSHNYILKPIPYGLLRISVYINNFILEKKPSLNLEQLKHTPNHLLFIKNNFNWLLW